MKPSKLFAIWGIGLGIALQAMGPQSFAGPATPAVPNKTGPTTAPAARAKASLEPLIQQGIDALAGGQPKVARESFHDATLIDGRSVKAMHGLAVACFEMRDTSRAREIIEKALLASPSPDRAIVINAAAINQAVKNNARAAKLLKDYLTANPKVVDEPMVNALGSALMAASGNERKNRMFADAASFYEIANKRLESARPGYKRFGMDWHPAAQADVKMAAMATQQKKLDTYLDAVDRAEELLEPAAKEVEKQKFLVTRGESPFYLQYAQTAYDLALTNANTARERLDEFSNSIERPKFPQPIAMVSIDQTTAPSFTDPVETIASVTPTRPDPTLTNPVPPIRKPVKPPVTKPEVAINKPTKPVFEDPETLINKPLEPVVTRTPKRVRITQYAAAFAISPDMVITAAGAVHESATLQLQASDGSSINATLVRVDPKLGLALLKVEGRKLNPLMLADAFAGGAISCCAYPTVDLFNPSPQLLVGSAAPIKENTDWMVALGIHPRLAGSPLIANGKVVGVCIATRDADRTKLPAVTLPQLKTFLGADLPALAAGVEPMSALLQLVSTRQTGE